MNRLKLSIIGVMALIIAGCTSTNSIIESKVNSVVYIQNAIAENKVSAGTGFFIGENIILTNNHVIDGDGQIRLALESSTKLYEAKILFKDAVSDVAVIALKDWETFAKENTRVKYLTLTDTIPDRTSEVYAIGNPWGLTWSVSKGIVSYPLRRSPDGKPIFYVQTDGDIFNGNSGGPLINTDGSVVGINTLMIANDGGSYGLAIISEIVNKVLEDYERFGFVKWPSIGVIIEEGTTIKEVNEESPAKKAGLEAGDVIINIDNGRGSYYVQSLNDLLFRIVTSVTEKPLLLTYVRSGKEYTAEIHAKYRTSEELLANS